MKTTSDNNNNIIKLFKLKQINNVLNTFLKHELVKKLTILETILINLWVEQSLDLSLDFEPLRKKNDLPYIHHYCIIQLIFYRMLPIDCIIEILHNYDFNQSLFKIEFKEHLTFFKKNICWQKYDNKDYFKYLLSIQDIDKNYMHENYNK